MLHIDDWLDDPATGPADVKEWLEHFRRPAIEKDHAWLRARQLFCTYKDGKRYRCIGCSRMGDVWLTANFDRENGYDLRIDIADCTDWEVVSNDRGVGPDAALCGRAHTTDGLCPGDLMENEMQNAWKQNTQADTDQWDWKISDGTYGHITQYAGTNSYCWQAVRGDFRLSGIAVGRDAAINRAEEIMALPIDEFNRRVTVELIDKFREIERDILRLSPSSDLLPGYHAGYEAGAADIRRSITAAIDLGDEGHNVELRGRAL